MLSYFCSSYNGWGVTAFDALDTMLLMDLKEEYRHAIRIVEKADFNQTTVKYYNHLSLSPL